ncbi:phosphotransferase [Streptomyces yerevanensis]|uniref:phosphotransferase n=1 Tax=Streptomyces yerevanensis TaxID=66378 RepID=UPI001FDF94F7|nr:phosphotransferase [Streptomyces yerevanensis]
MALQRAVEVSGNASVVEGPLQGYHHETYVFPLPGKAEGLRQVRWKCREPRSNAFWFDRRCFASEEDLIDSLQGRITGIPEIFQAETVRLQRFIEGETLGWYHKAGQAIPPSVFEQIVELFRQLVHVTPDTLLVKRTCKPTDRAKDGDTSGFLEGLIRFTEKRVYEEKGKDFAGLFGELGVKGDSFEHLRKQVSGLNERPFCLLHADLHRENFILDREGLLWAIDWELAMLGDPLYDLATHLYLMRYPKHQEDQMVERWCEVVDEVRPGSSAGWKEDLPKLLNYKKAQSVFTDVIRESLSLDLPPEPSGFHGPFEPLGADQEPDPIRLSQAGIKVHDVLTAAADPLGLETVPNPQKIKGALAQWYRNREPGKKHAQ